MLEIPLDKRHRYILTLLEIRRNWNTERLNFSIYSKGRFHFQPLPPLRSQNKVTNQHQRVRASSICSVAAWWHTLAILALGRLRQENPWHSLACQPSLLDELATKRPWPQNQGGWCLRNAPEDVLWPPHTCACTYMTATPLPPPHTHTPRERMLNWDI